MRIIGGALSGRQIIAPSGQATRPTSDRVREAIFNRLVHGALGEAPLAAPVLDLYAGSGGLGLEALSRGAPRCDFVEQAGAACAAIQRNLDALGLADRGHLVRAPVEAFLRRSKGGYGLVFLDPPYAEAGPALDRALSLLVERDLLLPGALVLVEHGADPAPRAVGGGQPGLTPLDQRSYGQTIVSFLASGLASGDRGIRRAP